MFIIQKTMLDQENGEVFSQNSGFFLRYTSARIALEHLFREELANRQLEENGTSDADGNSIPGGYISNDEAGIYDFAEFANDQLLQVVLFTIQPVAPHSSLELTEKYLAHLAERLGQMSLRLQDAYMPVYGERAADAQKVILQQAELLDFLQCKLQIDLNNPEQLDELAALVQAKNEKKLLLTSSAGKTKRLAELSNADSKHLLFQAPIKNGDTVYLVGPKLICDARGSVRQSRDNEVYSGLVVSLKFTNDKQVVVEVIEDRFPANNGPTAKCQRCREYVLGVDCFPCRKEAESHL